MYPLPHNPIQQRTVASKRRPICLLGGYAVIGCSIAPERGIGGNGGDGGIRTLDRALQPYNGLANRRLQPLGHVSGPLDMPDTVAARKRDCADCTATFGPVHENVGATRGRALAFRRFAALPVSRRRSDSSQQRNRFSGFRHCRPSICRLAGSSSTAVRLLQCGITRRTRFGKFIKNRWLRRPRKTGECYLCNTPLENGARAWLPCCLCITVR